MGTVAVVVGGGSITDAFAAARARALAERPEGSAGRCIDLVIAADSGLDHALAAGLRPQVLVGDLDSVSATGLEWARRHGVEVVGHPRDKEDTDTALALGLAAGSGCDRLVLLGALVTDRLDHLLATAAALGTQQLAAFASVTAHIGLTEVVVAHPGREVALRLEADRTFSVLALAGECAGVTITGARWPLTAATIAPGATVGVSNRAASTCVTVSVDRSATAPLTIVVPPAPNAPAGTGAAS